MDKEKIKEILDLFENDSYADARELLKEELKKDVLRFVTEKAKLKKDDDSEDDDDSDDDDSDDDDSDDDKKKKKK
jgi:hypothetical protein